SSDRCAPATDRGKSTKKQPKWSTFSSRWLESQNSRIHQNSTHYRQLQKQMKTPRWFTRNRAPSHLRVATAVTLSFAAAAMALFAAATPTAGPAGAQAFTKPGPLLPIPPKKGATRLAETAVLAANSPWQLLTNQPPVLDYADCGPGNPILLTDGTVMLQDDGCQDWWRLTPDAFGSYVNGTWTQLASLPDGYSPLYHATAVLSDGRVI